MAKKRMVHRKGPGSKHTLDLSNLLYNIGLSFFIRPSLRYQERIFGFHIFSSSRDTRTAPGNRNFLHYGFGVTLSEQEFEVEKEKIPKTLTEAYERLARDNPEQLIRLKEFVTTWFRERVIRSCTGNKGTMKTRYDITTFESTFPLVPGVPSLNVTVKCMGHRVLTKIFLSESDATKRVSCHKLDPRVAPSDESDKPLSPQRIELLGKVLSQGEYALRCAGIPLELGSVWAVLFATEVSSRVMSGKLYKVIPHPEYLMRNGEVFMRDMDAFGQKYMKQVGTYVTTENYEFVYTWFDGVVTEDQVVPL